MKKRVLVLLSMILWLAGLPLAAHASEKGSMQITLLLEKKPAVGIQLLCSRAGDAVAGGYLLNKEHGGGFISEADLLLPELAKWLAEESDSGIYSETDEQGQVKFSELDEGIYLVRQIGKEGEDDLFEPFLTVIPWDGYEWNLELYPISEPNRDSPADTSDPSLVMAALPAMIVSCLGTSILVWLNRTKKIN